jgi:hypothetical protein
LLLDLQLLLLTPVVRQHTLCQLYQLRELAQRLKAVHLTTVPFQFLGREFVLVVVVRIQGQKKVDKNKSRNVWW